MQDTTTKKKQELIHKNCKTQLRRKAVQQSNLILIDHSRINVLNSACGQFCLYVD